MNKLALQEGAKYLIKNSDFSSTSKLILEGLVEFNPTEIILEIGFGSGENLLKSAKMNPDVLDKMMRQIVPCRMAITAVDGTWKLSQNKPDPVRMRAADGVAAYGLGTELGVLAALMRGVK